MSAAGAGLLQQPRGPAPEGATSYLHPGRFLVCAEPSLIATILGSCVSLCLWDQAAGVGGMNHFLLPDLLSGIRSTRFAGPACEELLGRLLMLGARRHGLRAKLFGGACLRPDGAAGTTIGSRNVEVARRFVLDSGIPLAAEDVGGNRGRKLVFDTAGGNAWVRLLRGAP